MPNVSIRSLFALTITFAASAAQAQSWFNPTIPAAGFNVFTKSAVQFSAGDTHGPVATGGDVILAGNTVVSMNYNGYHPFGNGNSANYGLVIGGRVWYNSGNQSALNRGQVRIGSLAGGNLYQINSSTTQTQIHLAPGAQNSSPNIQSNSQTQLNTATSGNGLNFAAAFNAFQNYSTVISNYPSTHPYSPAINYLTMPPTSGGGSYTVNVAAGKINYLAMTAAQFAAMNASNVTYTFNRTLDSSTVVIFNVSGSSTITWDPANWGGISDNSMGDGRYILYNFPSASRINIVGGRSTIGSILAPGAAIYKTGGNNAAGTIIADTLAIQYGEVHYAPFGGLLPGTSTALPVEQLALNGSLENGTVRLHWTAATEVDAASLTLERSTDGSNFSQHVELGSGRSGVWEEPVSGMTGKLYYRLRQIGPDGASGLSSVWRTELTQRAAAPGVYPNPFSDQLQIGNGSKAIVWSLYNVQGIEIRSGSCEGRCLVTTLSDIPIGSYFIRVTADGVTSLRQILKK